MAPQEIVRSTSIQALEAAPAETSVDGKEDWMLTPDPSAQMAMSDDAIFQIASLLAEAAASDRRSSRHLRTAQEHNFELATARRVRALHDKADATRTAAWVSGLAGIAAGGVQATGGALSMSEAGKIETSGKAQLVDAPETGAVGIERSSSLASQEASSRAQAWGQLGGGVGGLVSAGGNLVSGVYQSTAEDLDAEAAKQEADAGRAARAIEDLGDQMKQAVELQAKAMDFLKAVRDSQNAASQSAVLRG